MQERKTIDACWTMSRQEVMGQKTSDAILEQNIENVGSIK